MCHSVPQVDNIIIIGGYAVDWWMTVEVKRFQKLSISEPLVVEVLISST